MSSVWSESYQVRILWTTMLAVKDADHVVRMTAYQLSKLANMAEDEVLEALKVLSSPDTRRKEPQPHEGRRIAKAEDGWLILNGEKYQRLMRKENRRDYQREYMRERRAGVKTGGRVANPEPTEYEPERQKELREKSIALGKVGRALPGAEQDELSQLNRMEESIKLPASVMERDPNNPAMPRFRESTTEKLDQEAKAVFEAIKPNDVPY